MSDLGSYAFNTFCRNDAPDICCAVPESRPVPLFLEAPVWSFMGKLDNSVMAGAGLKPRVVEEAIRLQGYYIFQKVVANR